MKTIKILALMAALPLVMVSCSGEESDAMDDAVLDGTDDSNVLVTNVKYTEKYNDYGYSFTYNDDNQCTSIFDLNKNQSTWWFSYSPFVLTAYDESDSVSYTGTLNSSGMLSELTLTYEGKAANSARTISYCYDSKQLTSITYHYDYEYNIDNKYYYQSRNYEAQSSLTWKDGNLTKVVTKWSETFNGKTEEYTYTANIAYGSEQNSSRQYLMLMEKVLEDIADNGMGFAGLLGVGPKMLPSHVVETWSNKDDVVLCSCSYVLNDDGTIAYEAIDDAVYTYSYVTAE